MTEHNKNDAEYLAWIFEKIGGLTHHPDPRTISPFDMLEIFDTILVRPVEYDYEALLGFNGKESTSIISSIFPHLGPWATAGLYLKESKIPLYFEKIIDSFYHTQKYQKQKDVGMWFVHGVHDQNQPTNRFHVFIEKHQQQTVPIDLISGHEVMKIDEFTFLDKKKKWLETLAAYKSLMRIASVRSGYIGNLYHEYYLELELDALIEYQDEMVEILPLLEILNQEMNETTLLITLSKQKTPLDTCRQYLAAIREVSTKEQLDSAYYRFNFFERFQNLPHPLRYIIQNTFDQTRLSISASNA